MLKKHISKKDVIAIAIGSIIGWGAFILPGEFFLKKIGFQNSIIGLFIGALVVMIIEKNYSYLIKKVSDSGGEYSFTKLGFGKEKAYLCGWFLLLSYICIVPLNATAVILILKKILGNITEIGYLYSIQGEKIYFGEILIVSIILLIFGWMNIKNSKWTALIQKIIVLLLVGIILFFVVYIVILERGVNRNIEEYISDSIDIKNILKVIAISPWAYLGFDCVTKMVKELKFPLKEASKLSVLSIFIGFLLYVIIIIITAYGVPETFIISDKSLWATGESIYFYFGQIGMLLLAMVLLFAVFGGIYGFIFTTSRLLYTISYDNLLPIFFTKLDKNKSPKNSILFVVMLSMLAPWFGRKILEWIVSVSSFGATIGYIYTSLSTIKIYYIENKKIKITGILGVILGIMFTIILIFPQFGGSLSLPGFILLILWLILGCILKRRKK